MFSTSFNRHLQIHHYALILERRHHKGPTSPHFHILWTRSSVIVNAFGPIFKACSQQDCLILDPEPIDVEVWLWWKHVWSTIWWRSHWVLCNSGFRLTILAGRPGTSSIHNSIGISVRGDFWAESVEILVFWRSTGYVLTSFVVKIWRIFYKFSQWICMFSWNLEYESVVSQTQPVEL